MCGITGIIYKNQKINTPIDALFAHSLDTIANRGEKKIIYKLSDTERYGYMRLPTDGLAAQDHQDIKTEVSPLLLYNGILNNVSELNIDAQLNDHQVFRNGLQTQGINFLKNCRGMFAGAYIENEKIILFRDTIGIKPLYYFIDTKRFAFASEIKALLPYKPKQILEVLPGQIIELNLSHFKIKKKTFSYQYQNQLSTNHTQKLETLLHESLIIPTERYLAQSSKKIGLLLSGGLDSSILLALLDKYIPAHNKQRIVCFCVGLPESEDTQYAQKVAQFFNLPIHILKPPSEQQCAAQLKQMIYKTESPYARVVKVAFLQEKIANKAKRLGIDVVISGEGADELFYGYRKFIDNVPTKRIENIYTTFFETMFYKTLLQRLDRIFAQKCIEARVPFLDQEFVAYAKSLNTAEKISRNKTELSTKIPLRRLAQKLGLPTEVYTRPKTTMTLGATMQENKEDPEGYLELFFKKKYRTEIGIAVKKQYLQLFGRKGNDILKDGHIDLRKKELLLTKKV